MALSRFMVGIFSLGLMVLGANVVSGQDYPNKSIRIVAAAAGGSNDFTARIIAQELSTSLGQPVIVDNRRGIIPMEILSKAPANGYTLLVAGALSWIFPLLEKAPYDVMRDFSPISLLVREVNILVVHPSLPVKSVKELIALAKAKPGELNYGSSAVGGASHLSGELFKSMAGINTVWVPYKGNAAQISALISGEVQMMILNAGLVEPHVKSGRLRALAVTSAEPSIVAPGLPTVAASGVPGYERVTITGMFAPAETPGPIIDLLNKEVVRMLSQPHVKERFLNAKMETIGSSAEQFAATIKSEVAKTTRLIRDAGIRIR